METFKHFNLVSHADGVAVHDPRWPGKILYVAPDRMSARRWVSAYRDGTTWAVQAAR